MRNKLVAALFLATALCLVPGAQAAPKIHAGKALHKAAAVVSAPVRHPMATTKASFAFTYTGFLAGVETVGVTLEAVGTGVQKVGTYIYDVGGVLAGGKS